MGEENISGGILKQWFVIKDQMSSSDRGISDLTVRYCKAENTDVTEGSSLKTRTVLGALIDIGRRIKKGSFTGAIISVPVSKGMEVDPVYGEATKDFLIVRREDI